MAQHPRTSLFQRNSASQCLISRRRGPEGQECCRDWMWFIRGSNCAHHSAPGEISSHIHQVAYMDYSRLCSKQGWAGWLEFFLFVSSLPNIDTSKISNMVPDSESQKTDFRTDQKSSLQYRKDIENELNSRFRFVRQFNPGLHMSRSLTFS